MLLQAPVQVCTSTMPASVESGEAFLLIKYSISSQPHGRREQFPVSGDLTRNGPLESTKRRLGTTSEIDPHPRSVKTLVSEWLESIELDRENSCSSDSHLYQSDDDPVSRKLARSALEIRRRVGRAIGLYWSHPWFSSIVWKEALRKPSLPVA